MSHCSWTRRTTCWTVRGAMYSAALNAMVVDAVRGKAPPFIKKVLGQLQREWQLLQRDQVAALRGA